MNRERNSHPNNATGARMAVSFDSAASENNIAVPHGRSSIYERSPQKVNPAAARSTCASELWVKKTGYTPVSATVADATAILDVRKANRKIPSSENALTASIAVRVASGE